MSQAVEVVFHLQSSLGRLPFTKQLRSSSNYKRFEVVFQNYFWQGLPNILKQWKKINKYSILKLHQLSSVGLGCFLKDVVGVFTIVSQPIYMLSFTHGLSTGMSFHTDYISS